jgi:hypothetical protein
MLYHLYSGWFVSPSRAFAEIDAIRLKNRCSRIGCRDNRESGLGSLEGNAIYIGFTLWACVAACGRRASRGSSGRNCTPLEMQNVMRYESHR